MLVFLYPENLFLLVVGMIHVSGHMILPGKVLLGFGPSLKKQLQNNSSLEILKASLEERLEAKENEAREKLKFLEEAKKLMGTEFENLSTKIFETKSKQFTEEIKNNIQNYLLNLILKQILLNDNGCQFYY